jgi:hypothetical protein
MAPLNAMSVIEIASAGRMTSNTSGNTDPTANGPTSILFKSVGTQQV